MKSALGRPEAEETEAGRVAEDAQVPFRHQGVQVIHILLSLLRLKAAIVKSNEINAD